MSWFKRTNKNINTKTEEKKDIPAGLWYKTPTGKVIETKELAENMYVSPEDDYHVHIGSKEYFEILFDGKFKEIGIKHGFIVTHIDKNAVKTINDLKNIIKNKKSSTLIEGIYPNGLKGYYVLDI